MEVENYDCFGNLAKKFGFLDIYFLYLSFSTKILDKILKNYTYECKASLHQLSKGTFRYHKRLRNLNINENIILKTVFF